MPLIVSWIPDQEDWCAVSVEQEKRAAAEAAALLVEDGMAVGGGNRPPLSVPVPELPPRRLCLRCGASAARTARAAALSPDGGVLADYQAPFDDPAKLAARLSEIPGVIGHGLFSPKTVSTILIGRGNEVERRILRG